VFDIQTETRRFIEAALAGDPALAGLVITGSSAADLAAEIEPGRPPSEVGRSRWDPAPPFLREHVVGLVVRMQKLRWSRYDSYTLALRPPGDVDLLALQAFDCLHHPPYVMRASVGPGWADMLHAALEWIYGERPAHDWKASDIKEKFGTLRFYHYAQDHWISSILEAAEHISGFVCEDCGAPGHNAAVGGWWRTRCGEHAE
jgi:hypothetical protein